MEYNSGGQPVVRVQDFNLAVAQGKVPGVTGINISGYQPAAGTTFTPAWRERSVCLLSYSTSSSGVERVSIRH